MCVFGLSPLSHQDSSIPKTIIMKTLKFLFIAVLLSCFAIAQTNAQADIYRGINIKDVYWEIDGVKYAAYAELDYHYVVIPSGHHKWVAVGEIFEVYKFDGGWILLDEIVPPKKTVIYYDPYINNEKVTITPSGKVTVVMLLKDAP